MKPLNRKPGYFQWNEANADYVTGCIPIIPELTPQIEEHNFCSLSFVCSEFDDATILMSGRDFLLLTKSSIISPQ